MVEISVIRMAGLTSGQLIPVRARITVSTLEYLPLHHSGWLSQGQLGVEISQQEKSNSSSNQAIGKKAKKLAMNARKLGDQDFKFLVPTSSSLGAECVYQHHAALTDERQPSVSLVNRARYLFALFLVEYSHGP